MDPWGNDCDSNVAVRIARSLWNWASRRFATSSNRVRERDCTAERGVGEPHFTSEYRSGHRHDPAQIVDVREVRFPSDGRSVERHLIIATPNISKSQLSVERCFDCVYIAVQDGVIEGRVRAHLEFTQCEVTADGSHDECCTVEYHWTCCRERTRIDEPAVEVVCGHASVEG